MNFLAHLLLADDHPHARLGSILPDFVRPRKLPPPQPAPLLQAIAQHQAVDRFTDTHPLVSRSKQRVPARYGLFAGILIDIVYDHLLAWQWERLAAPAHGTLTRFAPAVYRDLLAALPDAPPAMQIPVRRMVRHDWLNAYATPAGWLAVLQKFSQRLSLRLERAIDLTPPGCALLEQRAALLEDFAEFFPQLQTHARAWNNPPGLAIEPTASGAGGART